MVFGVKTILHLCADTGSDSRPYAVAGYNVVLVGSDVGVENYTPPDDVYGIFANPVCTEFSTAKGRDKHGDIDKGMFLVDCCLRIIQQCSPKFWVIENPATGRLHERLGEPNFVYQPWHYGSPWTKKTALWGCFNKPAALYKRWEDVPKIEGLYVRPGRKKPSLAFLHKSAFYAIPEFWLLPEPKSDMEFRSLCSQRFAQAFFDVNR